MHLLKGLLGFPLQIPSHAVFAVDLRWWLLVGDVLISRLRHFFVQHFCLPAKPAKNREPEVEFSKTKLRRFYPPIEWVSDFPQPQEQTFYFLFARSQNSEKSKTKLDCSPKFWMILQDYLFHPRCILQMSVWYSIFARWWFQTCFSLTPTWGNLQFFPCVVAVFEFPEGMYVCLYIYNTYHIICIYIYRDVVPVWV